MDDVTDSLLRGPSSSSMREFTCKDCQRELDRHRKDLEQATRRNRTSDVRRLTALIAEREKASLYNEHWAKNIIERGGSRSDRCKDHRAKHKINIQGMAVAYIDIKTVGEVSDRKNPKGPLGGLGPLPDKHVEVPGTSYNLMEANVGMTDEHALQMIRMLRDKRVLVLKAGTGTGKSTFAPYRLMDPPSSSYAEVPVGAPFAKLTDLGQIVVTEPRVQAARGVAGYVGGVLSGAGGVGPGFPVGYQVSGDRNHDEACQLVYVTDGTMINWLREGRLSRIGTVIVDEAHERSVNIDFIMGYLRRELDRYPHLRVIITSATFDAQFYQEYFGGPDVANVMEVPAVKSFGYGMPLFPELDGLAEGESDVVERWTDEELPLSGLVEPRPVDAFVQQHWKEQFAPPLPPDDVRDGHDGDPEDVWDTTRKLLDLRYRGKIDIESWQDDMPDAMAKFVIDLARGLDEAEIFGDILGFLPTTKQIEQVVEQIQKALGKQYNGHVFPLISTLKPAVQQAALAKRRKGDPRKIVISTNLAETSLTVEGVRFVVDSGVIAQSEWDPHIAQGGVYKKLHSQAGIKQRWGRVGRKAPGWVFPLYTKGQFLSLEQDTPPGSTRENLEALVMTARMGGVDDILNFPWPAAFEPTTTRLEQRALDAQAIFKTELKRADAALRAGGAVDGDGHPTSLGKELTRFSTLGSSNAMAVLYADRLGCVPEIATVMSLLGDNRLVGNESLLQDTFEWPDEWRLEAAGSHRALAGLAEDEAHLALLIMAAWERADPKAAPWEPSAERARWAARWWVNDELLLAAAIQRQEILSALSPAMKEEVKRFVEPALLDRTRGVLTRALQAQIYDTDGEVYTPRMPVEGVVAAGGDGKTQPSLARLEDKALVRPTGSVIAMRRRTDRLTEETRLSGVIRVAAWAHSLDGGEDERPLAAADAMRLLVRGAVAAPPDASRNAALGLIQKWPAGMRALARVEEGQLVECTQIVEPFTRPQKTEGAAAKRRKRRRAAADEDSAARRADAAGDLKGNRQGDADEEQSADAAFRAADRQSLAAGACQECFACRDGRPEDCDDPPDADAAGRGGRNPLQGWVARTKNHESAVREPAVVGVDDSSEPQWVEVVGLSIEHGSPTVHLIPDWRPVGFRGNPAQHGDLEPGKAVEVVVGPLLEDHGGPVRSFLRADELGRFVLREATNPRKETQENRREIASSLDRGVTGSLARLVEGRTITATVVPARFEGCLTVTSLELLHQHLAKTVPGVSTLSHQLDRRNSTTMHLARVVEEADDWGWVQFSLVHHDSFHGIEHRFRYRVPRPDGSIRADRAENPEPTGSEAAAADEFRVGQTVLLNLVRDYAELTCAELDLDALEQIASNSAGTLKLFTPEDRKRKSSKPRRTDKAGTGVAESDAAGVSYGEAAASVSAETAEDAQAAEIRESIEVADTAAVDADDDTDARLAPAGTELRTTQDKPLSRAAAMQLVELSDEDDWANEVWSFWARSHHRRLDQKVPYVTDVELPVLDERTAAMLDQRAVVIVDEENPRDRARRLLAEFEERTSVGTLITATVDNLATSGAFVSTSGGIDGFIKREELSWKEVKDPARFVTPGESIKVQYLGIDHQRLRLDLSYRQSQDAIYRPMKEALPVGSVVEATVRAVAVNAVYLDLYGGVTGEMRLSELAYEPPASAKDLVSVGEVLRVAVKRYDDNLRLVELSAKALLLNPFPAFAAAHPEGTVMDATVVAVRKNALDVRLAEGVRGYVMVRDFAATRTEDLTVVVAVGDVVRVRLMKHDTEKGETQASVHPFDVAGRDFQVGRQVSVRVTGATKGLAKVELDGGVPGAIRAREFAHDRPDDMTAAVSKGDILRAEVIEIDTEHREVKLSIKRLLPPPYQAFKNAHVVGQRVTGTVTNTIPSFAFVKLPGGAQGSIHVKQLSSGYVSSPDQVVSKGQTVQPVIIGFDDARERVNLSLIASATAAAPRQTAAPAARQAPSGPLTPSPFGAVPPGQATQPPRPVQPQHKLPPPTQPIRPTQPTRLAPAPKRAATAEGKNVEDAVAQGCAQLRLRPQQVRVDVLDQGEKGLFGRVKRMAKVRVTEL